MAFYYYLIAGLPDLTGGSDSGVADHDVLKAEILEHITPKDRQYVEQLYWPYDNARLVRLAQDYLNSSDKKAFFTQSEQDEKVCSFGNYSIKDLKEGFAEMEGLPPYMLDFIGQVLTKDKTEASLNDLEHLLLESFYRTVKKSTNAWVRDYYIFDSAMRNILISNNLRRLNRQEVHAYFVGDDDLVQILKKEASPEQGIKGEFEYAEALFQILEIENWLEREKKLDMLKWEFVDQQIRFLDFTSEVVFAFLLKLQWIHRWQKWSPQKGRENLKQEVDRIRASVSLNY